MSDRTIYVVSGCWWHDKENKLSKKGTTIKESQIPDLSDQDKNYTGDSLHELHMACCFHDGNKVLKSLPSNKLGRATIPQDGNCEGVGLSLHSMEDARKLAEATSRLHRKCREIEQEQKKLKEAQEAKKLSKYQNDMREVYFYAKQDYDYRGLDSTYSGNVGLYVLVKYQQAILMEEYDKVDSIEKALIGRKDLELDDDFQHSLSCAFSETDQLVQTLIKKKKVSCVGETGYMAFSFKSINEAKKLVKQAYLEENFDQDEVL